MSALRCAVVCMNIKKEKKNLLRFDCYSQYSSSSSIFFFWTFFISLSFSLIFLFVVLLHFLPYVAKVCSTLFFPDLSYSFPRNRARANVYIALPWRPAFFPSISSLSLPSFLPPASPFCSPHALLSHSSPAFKNGSPCRLPIYFNEIQVNSVICARERAIGQWILRPAW